MSKISITLDVGKINKSRIVDRTYKNRDGQDVTIKEYKLDLVPLKEPKTIKEGDTWVLKKTHFLAEQREKGETSGENNYVGEGFQFFDKGQELANIDVGIDEDPNPDDIPF